MTPLTPAEKSLLNQSMTRARLAGDDEVFRTLVGMIDQPDAFRDLIKSFREDGTPEGKKLEVRYFDGHYQPTEDAGGAAHAIITEYAAAGDPDRRVYADVNTPIAEKVQWQSYTDPDTGRSGRISPGGQVRYDSDPSVGDPDHVKKQNTAPSLRADGVAPSGEHTRKEIRGLVTAGSGKAAFDALTPAEVGRVSSILTDHSQPAGDVMVANHYMTAAEPMRKITVDGVEFRYPHTKAGIAAAAQTLASFARARLPAALRDVTGSVTITSQASRADKFYQKKYGRGFVTTATGGDGNIVAYRHAGLSTHEITHEAAHNFARRLWGPSQTPPPDSEYGKAQATESPVSDYAGRDAAEDFAEAVAIYLSPDTSAVTRFRDGHPKKYQAIVNLLIAARMAKESRK